MPPRKKGGALTPTTVDGRTLAEYLSFNQYEKPFKNPYYTKNSGRRARNLKAMLAAERERDRADREKRRVEGMNVDEEEMPTYASIEAPPSLWPQKHYCDITGLEAPYTDPRTGIRYHDKSVYDIVKGLSASTAKDYLSARGVHSIVK